MLGPFRSRWVGLYPSGRGVAAYSPECVEGLFSEVRIAPGPFRPVLRYPKRGREQSMSVSVDLVRDVVLVLIVVAVVLSFLQQLRDRAMWVREAENAKETLRRLLRSTIVLLLYLVFLCLFLSLTWWILSQPISEMK